MGNGPAEIHVHFAALLLLFLYTRVIITAVVFIHIYTIDQHRTHRWRQSL